MEVIKVLAFALSTACMAFALGTLFDIMGMDDYLNLILSTIISVGLSFYLYRGMLFNDGDEK